METNQFCVGFADRIITPDEPMPMGGYGNTSNRIHRRVLEDLHAICTAMTDSAGNTVLLLTTDTTRAYPSFVADTRKRICEETGIPEDRIMITATHTHSGPDLLNFDEESVLRYLPRLKDLLAQCAGEALEDRKVSRIFVGSVEATGLNFVKHYKHTTPEGETKFFGDNFGKEVMDETTRHATEADPTLHLIQFKREGGKDVVLANWRAHPQLTGGNLKLDMSADYPAAFRSVLGAQLNCHVHYLQGAAGNINPKSRIPGENYTTDHNVHGARLAYFAVKGLEGNMREVPAGTVRTKQVTFVGKVNHTMDHQVELCREITKYWTGTGDRPGAYRMCREHGLESPYQAASIIGKANLPETLELELDAIAVGDHVAFVTAPNELFDTNSVYTEEHSPFGMTFTCGYANDHVFYIPSRFGFEYNCYESHVSRFVAGTGEEVSETFLTMLSELKDA